MARQILKGSDLGNWGDAYAEGRKQREEELYRRAAQDLEAQQWAEGRYKKATKSPEGYFGGFESDIESRQRDIPLIKRKLPISFPEDASKPVKQFQEIPGIQTLVGPKSGSAAKTFTSTPEREAEVDKWFNELGGRAPQSGQLPPQPMQERPLLANPQKEKMAVDQTGKPVKLVGAAAEAENVRADENKAIPAVSPTGKPADVLMTEGMLQNQKNEAVVGGKPLTPPAEQTPSIAEESARVPADFNPSDSYLARLAEYSTTGQAKETQPQIAVGNLPEKWQRLVLGKQPEDPITPQEQSITVPADIVKAVVEQSYKPQAATKAAKPEPEYSPELAEAVGLMESGKTLSYAVGFLARKFGRPLKKNEMEVLEKTRADLNATKRAETMANQKPGMVGGVKLTPGQEATDADFGKAYSKIIMGGSNSPAKTRADLALMRTLPRKLMATTPTGRRGVLPETLKKQFYPQMQAIKQDYERLVSQNLKNTLGGQFAFQEAVQFFNRAYDDQLPPEINAERIKFAADTLEDMVKITERAIKHWETEGTMRGFNLRETGLRSWEDFEAKKTNQGAGDAKREERLKSAAKFSAPGKKIDIDKIDQFPLPGQIPQPGQIVQYNGKPFKYVGPADGDRGDQKNWEAVK